MNKNPIIPVILCGGSGTRLWPASREDWPKQFLALTNELSLFQNTVRRALTITGAAPADLVIVTIDALAGAIAEQFADLFADMKPHILREPSARNTAAAVALAAAYAQKTFGDDALLWILPSDHHIGDEDSLAAAYRAALPAATRGDLVTFGIAPTRPDTGYGYIRAKAGLYTDILPVESFVEKPDIATAQQYLDSGNYLWNSGMFLFSVAAIMEEFRDHAPAILSGVESAMTENAVAPEKSAYAGIESAPFDKAIMEKSSRVVVVPANPGWSDIGSWQSLWDLRDKDEHNNVTEGRAVCVNSTNSLIHANKTLIAIAGLDNIVVIETDDAILIMNKNDNESMRALVKKLKETGDDASPQTLKLKNGA